MFYFIGTETETLKQRWREPSPLPVSARRETWCSSWKEPCAIVDFDALCPQGYVDCVDGYVAGTSESELCSDRCGGLCCVLDRRTLAMGSRNGLYGWVMLGRLLRCQHWSCREFLQGGSQLLLSSWHWICYILAHAAILAIGVKLALLWIPVMTVIYWSACMHSSNWHFEHGKLL